MQRRNFTSGLFSLGGLWAIAGPVHAEVTEVDAASGIRAALQRGAESAVGLLGQTDGFAGNPRVRIPLPCRKRKRCW
jgi:hypothetical protein